jgi:hypothetical protein
MGQKLNVTHQILVSADMNLLRDNIDTTAINTGTSIEASKENVLEINVKKST